MDFEHLLYLGTERVPLTCSGVWISLPHSKGRGGLSSVETLTSSCPEHLGFVGPLSPAVQILGSHCDCFCLSLGLDILPQVTLLCELHFAMHVTVLNLWNCMLRGRITESPLDCMISRARRLEFKSRPAI